LPVRVEYFGASASLRLMFLYSILNSTEKFGLQLLKQAWVYPGSNIESKKITCHMCYVSHEIQDKREKWARKMKSQLPNRITQKNQRLPN
jgi:hypothetical protein